MNTTEALQHLQEGKKIQDTKKIGTPEIYQLFDSFLGVYFLGNNEKFFILVEIEEFLITRECLKNNNWIVFSNPTPIKFFGENFDSAGGGHSMGASDLYEKGYTIKRLKTGEAFNNNDLSQKKFSLEDIKADDWEILEKNK